MLNKIQADEITLSAAFYDPRGRFLKYFVVNNKLKTTYEVLQLIFPLPLLKKKLRYFLRPRQT